MRTNAGIALAWVAGLVLLCACSTLPRHPSRLHYAPLKFERPRPTRAVLGNGMVVYLLESHELPLVSARFVVRTGEIYEPEDKAGLAELTGTVLRAGGTTTRTGDEIDQRLEFLSASIATYIGIQEGGASLSCLRKDFDETLALLAEILQRPRFAEDKIDLARKRMLEAIRRQNDSPNSIVSREFSKLIYASSPAWGRTPTAETVGRITREDLVRFHAQYFHPNNIIAGFAGDFDSAALLKKLEEIFTKWERVNVKFPAVPPLADRNEPSLHYVYKDIPQSYFEFGHLGIKRHSPDWYAAAVMNHILGRGGFTSRLMAEIRSNRGLAYHVGAELTEDTDRGRFSAWCQTKSESTHEAISVMLDIIRRMATDPISDDEMEKAKSAIRDGFVFRFEMPQQVVNEQVNLEYYGYPKDHLDTYIDKIMAVTKEDVRRVAKQYIHPDQMIILVVGDKSRFVKALDDLGTMREITLKKSD
jgi:predicted Zn-dependent peptidase